MAEPAENNVERFRPKVPCPECGKDSVRRHYPFCSPRCKDLDLNRWLSGRYVIASELEGEDRQDS